MDNEKTCYVIASNVYKDQDYLKVMANLLNDKYDIVINPESHTIKLYIDEDNLLKDNNYRFKFIGNTKSPEEFLDLEFFNFFMNNFILK
jgi:hypothetical protein